jgi:predicted RecB family nuclease
MEGTPSSSFVYLIGLQLVGAGRVTCHSLWADTEEDERRLVTELCDILEALPDPHLLHFGRYETKVFHGLLPLVSSEVSKRILADKTTDVSKLIDSNIYFPTYSNSLKDIAQFLGYKWATPNATGLDSIVWRQRWERTGAHHLKKRLICYNQDDCGALHAVVQFFQELPTEESPFDGSGESPCVKSVDASSRLAGATCSKRRWRPDTGRLRKTYYGGL